MKRPLAVIGFAYLAALQVAFFLGTDYSVYLAVFFVVIFAVVLFFPKIAKNTPIAVISITCAAAAMMLHGYTSAYVDSVKFLHGQTVYVEGVVCDVPYEQNGRCYYKLETSMIDLAGSPQSTKILVSSGTSISADLYDKVSATVRFYDESEQSYERWSISRGIYLRGSINTYSYMKVEKTDSRPLYYYALRAKQIMTEAVYDLLPENQAAFVTAVLLGDRSGMTSSQKDNLRSAGISHIAAVSGFHITVVTQLLFWFMSIFMDNKRRASFVSCFFVFAYMCVVGFSPSVFRAGIMQIIFLLSKSIFKKADSITSLGFSVAVICWLNPYTAADVGFLLSFASTLGIILCARPIYTYVCEHVYPKDSNISQGRIRLIKILEKPFKAVISVISVSVSALIFTLPIMIVCFRQFAVYSVIANLLISPAVSILLVSAVIMVICKVSVIFSFLKLPFVIICGILTNYILWAAEFVSELPFSTVTLSKTYVPVWLSLTAVIIFVILAVGRPRTVLKRAIPISLIMLIVFGIFDKVESIGSIKLSVIDVGEGISVMVSSGDDTLLLSCGGESDYYYGFNNYLKNSSVRDIDYMLLLDRKNESSAYAENVLRNYDIHAVQVYDEAKFYERTHSMIMQTENHILSDSDGEITTVHVGITDVQSMKTKEFGAVYFKINSRSFLICESGSDCSYIPKEWLNPDFVICCGDIQNNEVIHTGSIIISDSSEKLSELEEKFSLSSANIYYTCGYGNAALKISPNGNITIGREKSWLN